MTQVVSDMENNLHELIKEQIEDPELDLQQAKDAAKKLALTKCKTCMVLSWKNGKTGEFYPDRECGTQNKPAWIHYAQARGANLTIDSNNGDYIFMILKIKDF